MIWVYSAIRVVVTSAIMFAYLVLRGRSSLLETFIAALGAVLASHAVVLAFQLLSGKKKPNAKAVVALLLCIVLGAGALVYVVFNVSAPRGPLRYLTVDELMTSPDRWRGREIKLHGYLEIGTIRTNNEKLEFLLVEKKQKLKVRLTGLAPTTLQDRAEVVAQGRLGTDDVFVAHEVMAKCPSVYNTADGPKPAAEFR